MNCSMNCTRSVGMLPYTRLFLRGFNFNFISWSLSYSIKKTRRNYILWCLLLEFFSNLKNDRCKEKGLHIYPIFANSVTLEKKPTDIRYTLLEIFHNYVLYSTVTTWIWVLTLRCLWIIIICHIKFISNRRWIIDYN